MSWGGLVRHFGLREHTNFSQLLQWKGKLLMFTVKPLIDAHKRACEIANAMVPGDWELESAEHTAWLKAYDRAFAEEMGVGQ
jgi:hypothetical protein